MCGIVGYVGDRPALDLVVEGLRRLEYRGYDSAGVALVNGGKLQIAKKAGRIENLDKELADRSFPGTAGMGPTRWATHGPPNDHNTHPHTDAAGRVAVIHNGIIENFAELRHELESIGVEFASDTDTEVVAHLVARRLTERGEPLADAVRAVCRRLHGAFTLLFLDAEQPDVVVGARRPSPAGLGREGRRAFFSHDATSFADYSLDERRNAAPPGHRRRRRRRLRAPPRRFLLAVPAPPEPDGVALRDALPTWLTGRGEPLAFAVRAVRRGLHAALTLLFLDAAPRPPRPAARRPGRAG